ncbi:glucose 1-dehydrogenase [Sphingopyxis sp.]|uniref:SDR family NAD(P)-dependent oxidoreductase n=1 Tax=Sphingopyxis sp. TaxID=1908224 RepID=UPI002D79E13E|nr:glucose 1-dehydrogenase [Sphingopyxis sp.]HET6522867.1 glucose 1-dehydrogenase [Sphingopyxis sp.]
MAIHSLDGKVAFVTGGGDGMGRATARALVEHGARVLVVDINAEKAAETAEMIGGDAVDFVAADVSSFEAMENAVERVVAKWGRLDVAFNNAGIESPNTLLAETSVETWQKVLAVNLSGPFYCMKAQIPAMIAGGGGSIVNTSSGLGMVGLSGASPYVAAKHGLIGLTKNAAIEYGRSGIRVNTLIPGLIMTRMLKESLDAFPDVIEGYIQQIPVGRAGEPSEIADAIVWLASDASTFVSGSTVTVDGGWLAQ